MEVGKFYQNVHSSKKFCSVILSSFQFDFLIHFFLFRLNDSQLLIMKIKKIFGPKSSECNVNFISLLVLLSVYGQL